jgi:hypothetical protein
MPGSPRRPRFYLGILLSGFVLGGFLTAFLRRFLPDSPTKDFFTYAVRPGFGPIPIDLIVVHFTLIGVVLAYLVARSLF